MRVGIVSSSGLPTADITFAAAVLLIADEYHRLPDAVGQRINHIESRCCRA